VETRKGYMLVEESLEKRCLEDREEHRRKTLRWAIGCKDERWMKLSQDRVQWLVPCAS
jgi:hypothetical protein